MRLKTLALNPYMHLVLLALAVFITFNRTLGSYFLADDFGEVAYVSRIASGDLGMLWANFSGNYMQISSMSVWRPWLLISLLTDFIVWGARPFGYYLTNLLSYTGVCLSLYLLIRNLTRDWCKSRASLAAFFSALIFALNPLHCESISWVVGRVDIICAFFYLACLNLFILSMRAYGQPGKRLTILSVVSFWLAMWTKEMAIGAPVLAFAIALLWGQPALDCKKSLRLCTPLFISTVIYFILRYLALGTILGGYTQGIGDAQAAGALSHWLDADTARRLFFPLAFSIYGSNHLFQSALSLIYALLAALLLLRLGSLSLPLRWVILLPIWLITTLAPIYKLWGLGYELEGARFVFFATMPLSSILPILLFNPHTSGAAGKGPGERRFRRAFAALSLLGLLSLSLIYGKVAGHLNLEWVHAGKEVREFAEKSRELAGQDGAGNTIILGIPKRRGGAHMVLNGTTFQILLKPPFTKSQLGEHFLTFDPIIFGNADYINAQRFKDCVAQAGTKVMIWDSEERLFKSLSLQASKNPLPRLYLPTCTLASFLHTPGHASIDCTSGIPLIRTSTSGDGIYFGNLNFSPLDADFLEVTLNCLQSEAAPLTLNCYWDDNAPIDGPRQSCFSPADIKGTRRTQTVYLRLSQNFHWYAQKAIHSLFLELPRQSKIVVQAVKLLKAGDICPQLTIKNPSASISALGVYSVNTQGYIQVQAVLPKSLQNGQVLLEISKPNAFFENFDRQEQYKAIQTTQPKNGAATLTFAVPPLQGGANYQIRARVIDKLGQALGEPSDPLVVR
jgi:hypothetical protein